MPPSLRILRIHHVAVGLIAIGLPFLVVQSRRSASEDKQFAHVNAGSEAEVKKSTISRHRAARKTTSSANFVKSDRRRNHKLMNVSTVPSLMHVGSDGKEASEGSRNLSTSIFEVAKGTNTEMATSQMYQESEKVLSEMYFNDMSEMYSIESKESEALGPWKKSRVETNNGRLTSSMVLIFTLMFLGFIYGTHSKAKIVANSCVTMLSTVFAIVCGLMVVEIQAIIWTRSTWYLLGVELTKSELWAVVLFFPWFLSISPLAYLLREDRLSQFVWVEGILAHVAAFTVIDLVGYPQAKFAKDIAKMYPGNAYVMTAYYFLWVLGVLALYGISSKISHWWRQNKISQQRNDEDLQSEEPEWAEIAVESETDSSAIAFGYVTMHCVWSLIDRGVAHPYDPTYPYKASSKQCTIAAATAGVMALMLVPMAKIAFRGSYVWLAKAEIHFADATGWLGYLALKLINEAHVTEDYKAVWASVISRKFLSCAQWMALLAVIMIVMSCLHTRGWIDKLSIEQISKASFLICGVFAEKIYGLSISTCAQFWGRLLYLHHLKVEPTWMELDLVKLFGLICGVCAMLPAWKHHFAPKVIAILEEQHEEHLSLDPTHQSSASFLAEHGEAEKHDAVQDDAVQLVKEKGEDDDAKKKDPASGTQDKSSASQKAAEISQKKT